MKQVLTIILLTCLASIGFAEDSKLEEISLDKLLRDYLPDCKIKKEVILDGKCYDFAVAKETGEILVVTGKEDGLGIYLYDKEGNLKWGKTHELSGYSAKCEISDNGSVAIITKYGEMNTNVVFDENGNIMFEKKSSYGTSLKASPDGQYFYFVAGMMGDLGNLISVYNRTGEKLTVTGYDFSKERRIRPVFLYHNKVIAYMDTKIVFFDFADGKFNLLSEYELGYHYEFNDFFQTNIRFNEKFIVVSSYSSEFNSFLFDYNGNFINKYPGFNCGNFINEDVIIVNVSFRGKEFLKLINFAENEISTYNFPFKRIGSYISAVELGSLIIISRNFYAAQKEDPTSAVFDKKSGRPLFGIQESIKCSSQNIVFLKQEENTSVLSIMEKNENKPDNICDAYKYPITPGTEDWKKIKNHTEMISVSQIPEDKLKKMSTEGLLETVLNCPVILDIIAFTPYQKGYISLFNQVNGLRELACRNELSNIILEKYYKLNNTVIPKDKSLNLKLTGKIIGIEMIISQNYIIDNLNPQQKIFLLKEAIKRCERTKDNQGYSTVFKNSAFRITDKLLHSLNYEPYIELMDTPENRNFKNLTEKIDYSFQEIRDILITQSRNCYDQLKDKGYYNEE